MKRFVCLLIVTALTSGAAIAQDSAKAPKKYPPFAESDTDKDGYLTQAEWDASGRSPKRFARIDADKDGRVSRPELREATLAARAAAGDQPKP